MKLQAFAGRIPAVLLVLGLLLTACSLSTEEIITGMVDQDDTGQIILKADDGEGYLVKGTDLSAMIGKTINVTGTLAEDGDHKTITVMNLEEVDAVEDLEGEEDLEDVDK